MIITVFGSAYPQPGSEEYELAHSVGHALAVSGFDVCNGGYGGTMEAVARGAKSGRARTYGVTVSSWRRSPNEWIDTVVEETSLFSRIQKLMALGDGYVVLQGGTGTLLEFAAMWEFMSKGLSPERPIVIIGDFWKNVLHDVKNQLLHEGRPESAALVTSVSSPDECAAFLVTALRGEND